MRRTAWMLLDSDGWPQRGYNKITTDPREAEEWVEMFGDRCVAKVTWGLEE